MHELSIAICIIDAVAEQSRQRGDVKINAVHVWIGPLSGVIPEALEPAFERARQGSGFDDCRLVVERAPIAIRCDACQAEREIPHALDLRCPVCHSPPAAVLAGREMDITAMEICDHEHAIG